MGYGSARINSQARENSAGVHLRDASVELVRVVKKRVSHGGDTPPIPVELLRPARLTYLPTVRGRTRSARNRPSCSLCVEDTPWLVLDDGSVARTFEHRMTWRPGPEAMLRTRFRQRGSSDRRRNSWLCSVVLARSTSSWKRLRISQPSGGMLLTGAELDWQTEVLGLFLRADANVNHRADHQPRERCPLLFTDPLVSGYNFRH